MPAAWPAEELEKIIRLRAEGLSHEAIGERLGRSGRRIDHMVGKLLRAGMIERGRAGPRHSPETISTIEALIKKGHSSSVIGQRLGMTRNVVIGIRHRYLQHLVHSKPKTRSEPARIPKRAAPTKKVRPMPTRPEFESAPLPREEVWRALPGAEPVSLLDLEEHHCRWPIGQQHVVGFCGCRKVPGMPYCEKHAATAMALPKEKARGVASGHESSASLKERPIARAEP
jgi:GcrA cell cycle regulator